MARLRKTKNSTNANDEETVSTRGKGRSQAVSDAETNRQVANKKAVPKKKQVSKKSSTTRRATQRKTTAKKKTTKKKTIVSSESESSSESDEEKEEESHDELDQETPDQEPHAANSDNPASSSAQSHATTVTQGLKLPKVKILKSFSDLSLMKDFVHDIENRGFQPSVCSLISRELVEKLANNGVSEPAAVLQYIKDKIAKIEKSSKQDGLAYWDRKINFSFDWSVPVESRLEDLYLDLNAAANKIEHFHESEAVRRRFLMMVAKKLDPRMVMTQRYLEMHPHLTTLEQFKKVLEENKVLGREEISQEYLNGLIKDGLSSSEKTHSIGQVTATTESTDDNISEKIDSLCKAVKHLSQEMAVWRKYEMKKYKQLSEKKKKKVDSDSESSVESMCSDDVVDKPPQPKSKTYEICSSRIGKDGYQDYSIRLKNDANEWRVNNAVLDSGAQVNVGVLENIKKYCVSTEPLRDTIYLTPFTGDTSTRVRAVEMGHLRGLRVGFPVDGRTKYYDFKSSVSVFLVPNNKMFGSNKLFIGAKTLNKEGLHPLQALKRKSNEKRDRSRSRSRSKSRDRKKKKSRSDSRKKSDGRSQFMK